MSCLQIEGVLYLFHIYQWQSKVLGTTPCSMNYNQQKQMTSLYSLSAFSVSHAAFIKLPSFTYAWWVCEESGWENTWNVDVCVKKRIKPKVSKKVWHLYSPHMFLSAISRQNNVTEPIDIVLPQGRKNFQWKNKTFGKTFNNYHWKSQGSGHSYEYHVLTKDFFSRKFFL